MSMSNLSSASSMDPITCYKGQNTGVCVRIGVLTGTILLTSALLIARLISKTHNTCYSLLYKGIVRQSLWLRNRLQRFVQWFLLLFVIIQYHCYKNRHYIQYFILYTGVTITFLLILHTVYFPHVQWDFAAVLLIAIQLLSMWFYYLFWAFRLLKKEVLFLYGVLPLSVILIISFVGVFLWASISASDSIHECTSPQWVIFSGSQLLIVQLFLITVIYICWYTSLVFCYFLIKNDRKLNQVRTIRINRWSQKAHMVSTYEVVSFVVFCYDLYLLVDKSTDCKTAITNNIAVFIFVEIFIKLLRFFVPQYAIVIIFAPLKQCNVEDTNDLPNPINTSSYPPYDSTRRNHFPSEKDPLISYPIRPPTHIKPSSPEDHYPSLPRSTPYTPSSGYNFYNFRNPTTVN